MSMQLSVPSVPLFSFFRKGLFTLLLSLLTLSSQAQEHSVARQWNEVLLEAIRNDLARPTVHARNLFHLSAAMYDAWAAYEEGAQPYLLGRLLNGFPGQFTGLPAGPYTQADQEEALSYAAYRLIRHRFRFSPGATYIRQLADSTMARLGYSPARNSTQYQDGAPFALGNYIASLYIAYGLQDGSNEANDYSNLSYAPLNPPLNPDLISNYYMPAPNRWQPLAFDLFIDQSGNPTSGEIPEFLSPEWGHVYPFSLQAEDSVHYQREEEGEGIYPVYEDPGPPPYLSEVGVGLDDPFKWGFALVAIWSAHLDPADTVSWDISPGALGNLDLDRYPMSWEEYPDFYDLLAGGDPSQGHALNPHTGRPYTPQRVKRADYARVLAEFWADGPDSETPPGHWFTILNYVQDHPEFERRYQGEGPEIDPLEWDLRAYFTLGGAMHDAAICAWSVKGWYDYVRPISAIRYMATLGQSSDPQLPRYHPDGIPLVPGYIEVIQPGDESFQAAPFLEGRVKLKGWRGPDFIQDPATDTAGVGWMPIEDWWPYQRPTFVTPPFAGYVSGHSTYSRAAAEVLTALTGDPFFPGGMGEFAVEKDSFLVFEKGPSEAFTLQWATYRDASDQTSLSRIWGGIHPPADDIPGRLIGERVGKRAFEYAAAFFPDADSTQPPSIDNLTFTACFPNPVASGKTLYVPVGSEETTVEVEMTDLAGRVVVRRKTLPAQQGNLLGIPIEGLSPGLYLVRVKGEEARLTDKVWVNP